jgi:hypothetical protein
VGATDVTTGELAGAVRSTRNSAHVKALANSAHAAIAAYAMGRGSRRRVIAATTPGQT